MSREGVHWVDWMMGWMIDHWWNDSLLDLLVVNEMMHWLVNISVSRWSLCFVYLLISQIQIEMISLWLSTKFSCNYIHACRLTTNQLGICWWQPWLQYICCLTNEFICYQPLLFFQHTIGANWVSTMKKGSNPQWFISIHYRYYYHSLQIWMPWVIHRTGNGNDIFWNWKRTEFL